jgi:hypothetical protein
MNPGVPPSSHQRLDVALDAAATAQEWDAMRWEAQQRGVSVLTVQREWLAEAEAARYADAARVNALIARYGSFDAIVAAAERERGNAQAQAREPEGPPSVGRSVAPPARR